MLHVFQQAQLSVGSFGVNDGLKWPRQFLNCHTMSRLCVKSSTNVGRENDKKKTVKSAPNTIFNTFKATSFPS